MCVKHVFGLHIACCHICRVYCYPGELNNWELVMTLCQTMLLLLLAATLPVLLYFDHEAGHEQQAQSEMS